MLRGLNFLFLFPLLFLTIGCGDKLNSLKIIGSDLISSDNSFIFNDSYKYIKLQVNSNPYSYLALGYNDYDVDGFNTSVWYSTDKNVLRIKHGRLHSISAVSKLWYGMNHLSLPNNNFSINSSYRRVRFGHNITDNEIIEDVYVSGNNKVPNSFKKFCNINNDKFYISEISVDQYGNQLQSFYGFLQNDTQKLIKCVFQELDKKNKIKWIYL